MNSDHTTQQKIATLLQKGVKEILPSTDYLTSLLTQSAQTAKTLTIYAGFDPTGPTLHLGHTIGLRKLRHFQELGHKIIFLVGDFTARIGDPTDKAATRKQLTEEEIHHNLRLYKTQASRFIAFDGENPAEIRFNNDWLGKMNFADVLNLASHMTVDQMLKRDMFARRMEEEKPIYLHEFLYPLMQGYDSVAMDVDGEIGGNDQLFNMMAGRTLLQKFKQKEKFVITTKLLEDNSGKKMGKTDGNMVSLIDTPEDMYGKIMSWTDGLIVPAFELCTDYSMAEVAEIEAKLASGINPRDLKMQLAHAIVATCTDTETADKAQHAFVSTFQKKESAEITDIFPIDGQTFEEIVTKAGFVKSKSELRQLIEAGAVSNFDTGEKMTFEQNKTLAVAGVYKIGKSRIFKLQ